MSTNAGAKKASDAVGYINELGFAVGGVRNQDETEREMEIRPRAAEDRAIEEG